MKIRLLILSLLGALLLQNSFAQHLEWELRFDSKFDNHERNAVSHLGTVTSQTLFSTRLAPVVGIGWGGGQNPTNIESTRNPAGAKNSAKHRIMAGGSFTLDFASSPAYAKDIEPLLFYNYSSPRHSIFAGKFERRHLTGSYSRATYSGIASFYDNVIDGVALQFHPASGKIEVVLDWDGAPSKTNRASFRVMSAGEINRTQKHTARWFEAGYSLDWYHLASRTGVHDGVVDHILAELWVGVAFERVAPWFQRLDLRLGAMSSFDRDRGGDNRWLAPHGATLDFTIQKWNVGIRNRFYAGDRQMPLWAEYGNRLYKGDPFFAGAGLYNYTQIYWNPRLGRGVDLNLELGLHTDGKGVGLQQVALVGVSLDRLFFRNK